MVPFVWFNGFQDSFIDYFLDEQWILGGLMASLMWVQVDTICWSFFQAAEQQRTFSVNPPLPAFILFHGFSHSSQRILGISEAMQCLWIDWRFMDCSFCWTHFSAQAGHLHCGTLHMNASVIGKVRFIFIGHFFSLVPFPLPSFHGPIHSTPFLFRKSTSVLNIPGSRHSLVPMPWWIFSCHFSVFLLRINCRSFSYCIIHFPL